MLTPLKLPKKAGLLILGLALLFGCSTSEPTRFYTLSDLASNNVLTERRSMRLGVGPVYLPAYLDRPQVVTRDGSNQMTIADFDQWAEPLETTFQRILTENLSTRLATDHVVPLPARREVALDHRVEIDVARFDADAAGEAVLDARWWIFDDESDLLQNSGRSVKRRQAVADRSYKDIAEAMSHCLGAMSEDIAEALAAL